MNRSTVVPNSLLDMAPIVEPRHAGASARGPLVLSLDILFVTARFYPLVGGTEQHTYEVGRRLVSGGHNVTVLTTDATGELPPTETIEGIRVSRVRAWPKGRDYYFAPGIYRKIINGRWDLVHCQGYHSFVAPLAMLAARMSHTPYYVSFHSGGHSSRLRNLLRAPQRMALRPLLAHAQRLIAVSEFEADFFSRHLHLPRQQFVVIPNGFDIPTSTDTSPDRATVVSVGRLERYKGHHRVIEAMPALLKMHPSARLVIVGSGPYEAALRRQIRALGLDGRIEIRAIPADSREQMAAVLAGAGVVTLLSEYEAHPVSVLEAVTMGRPVLVADTSGLSELARKGLATAIPLHSHPNRIAEALARQIESPVLPSATDLPTWDGCASHLNELYHRQLDRPGEYTRESGELEPSSALAPASATMPPLFPRRDSAGSSLSWHPLLHTAFHTLERSAVRWCLLRIPSNPAAPSGDVDLLVGRSDADHVQHLLETAGFVRFPGGSDAAGRKYLAYHAQTGRWLWLHVTTELSFGRSHALRTWAEVGCLERRWSDGIVATLAPDDMFWALLLHCILDKGSVGDGDARDIQALADLASPSSPIARAIEAVSPPEQSAQHFIESARNGHWTALESAATEVSALWMQKQGGRAWARVIHHRLRKIMRPGTILARRGLNVALLGPDGAGKSTLAAGISDAFFAPVCPIYMGLGHDRPALFASLRGPGLYTLGCLLTQWWRYAVAQYHQTRGRLVIFDRYTYDSLPPSSRHLSKFHRATRWMRAHACPPPNLVLVLDVPGEVMYTRKRERDPASLEADRRQLLALQHWVPHLYVVDGTRSADEVKGDVVNRLWELYETRWRGR